MQTGSSGTLIGWKSGQTTFVPLWDRMEGEWLWTLNTKSALIYSKFTTKTATKLLALILLKIGNHVQLSHTLVFT
jgi:hypothetical protein